MNAQTHGSFKDDAEKIVRIKNPFLYIQFCLQKEMYIKDGGRVIELFHDTAQCNIASIASSNLNYRLVRRSKFGQGVSFSPCPTYANKHSSHSNGNNRAMTIADVLVHRLQEGSNTKIPNIGYDTTTGNNRKVYVKYFDNEFYPKYAVYYTNKW